MKARYIGTMLIGAAVFVLLLLLMQVSRATSGPQWIDEGKFRNPVTGELCCGKYDCFEVNGRWIEYDDDTATFVVDWRGRHQRVAKTATLLSKNEHYHLCQRPDGSIRCFFRPTMML